MPTSGSMLNSELSGWWCSSVHCVLALKGAKRRLRMLEWRVCTCSSGCWYPRFSSHWFCWLSQAGCSLDSRKGNRRLILTCGARVCGRLNAGVEWGVVDNGRKVWGVPVGAIRIWARIWFNGRSSSVTMDFRCWDLPGCAGPSAEGSLPTFSGSSSMVWTALMIRSSWCILSPIEERPSLDISLSNVSAKRAKASTFVVLCRLGSVVAVNSFVVSSFFSSLFGSELAPPSGSLANLVPCDAVCIEDGNGGPSSN